MNELFFYIMFMPGPATLIFLTIKIYIELSQFLWSFILRLIAVAACLCLILKITNVIVTFDHWRMLQDKTCRRWTRQQQTRQKYISARKWWRFTKKNLQNTRVFVTVRKLTS